MAKKAEAKKTNGNGNGTKETKDKTPRNPLEAYRPKAGSEKAKYIKAFWDSFPAEILITEELCKKYDIKSLNTFKIWKSDFYAIISKGLDMGKISTK